jgi:hypothetical protein
MVTPLPIAKNPAVAEDAGASIHEQCPTAAHGPLLAGWSFGGFVILDYVRVNGTEGLSGRMLVGSHGGLRSIVHAMRGWPTPAAVPINTLNTRIAPDGAVSDEVVAEQLRTMATQVVEFASRPGGVSAPLPA